MTLVKENDIVKIPYRHPNHKNRYSKKWEMSKDNGTNVIKLLMIDQYGMPIVHNKSIWDGLIRPHIGSCFQLLVVRIDMSRQLRHHKK